MWRLPHTGMRYGGNACRLMQTSFPVCVHVVNLWLNINAKYLRKVLTTYVNRIFPESYVSSKLRRGCNKYLHTIYVLAGNMLLYILKKDYLKTWYLPDMYLF